LLQGRELPRVHAAGADVQRLAGAHHVVQRQHHLLQRRVGIEPVDLVEVDVVGAQALQAVVDGVADALARQTVVDAVAPGQAGLGGDDDLVAARAVAFDGAAQDFLAQAAGIGLGGVEQVEAMFERRAVVGLGVVLGQGPGHPVPGAVAGGAECQPRDAQAGGAQIDVAHEWFRRRSVPKRAI